MMNSSIFAFVSKLLRFKCLHTPTKNSKDAYPPSRKITKPSNENVSTAPVSPVYPVSVRRILDRQHDGALHSTFLFVRDGKISSNAQRLNDSRRTFISIIARYALTLYDVSLILFTRFVLITVLLSKVMTQVSYISPYQLRNATSHYTRSNHQNRIPFSEASLFVFPTCIKNRCITA